MTTRHRRSQTSSSPRGFTLYELLVVLVIIIILSGVAWALIFSVHSKSQTDAIITQLSALRAEAEYLNFSERNYNNVCASGSKSLAIFTRAASSSPKTGVAGYCLSSGTTAVRLNAGSVGSITTKTVVTPGQWAAVLQLPTTPATFYCVDYTGFSGIRASLILNPATPIVKC